VAEYLLLKVTPNNPAERLGIKKGRHEGIVEGKPETTDLSCKESTEKRSAHGGISSISNWI